MTFHWFRVYGLGIGFERCSIQEDEQPHRVRTELRGRIYLLVLIVNFTVPVGQWRRLS